MFNRIINLGVSAAKVIVALWLTFMGGIASFMLYNEIIDPEWGRQAKDRVPDEPEWYILLIIGLAAFSCFLIAYLLIRSLLRNRKKLPQNNIAEGGDNGRQ